MEHIPIIIAGLVIIREYFSLAGRRAYMKYAGFWMRLFITLLAWPDISIMLIIANLLWTGYDIACALALGQKWHFHGSTSLTEKMPDWVIWTLKGLLISITILCTI